MGRKAGEIFDGINGMDGILLGRGGLKSGKRKAEISHGGLQSPEE